jgi:ribosomal protein S6--L-glutamate ligase
MILSYHPLFEADRNITCAGREPNAEDLAVIREAQAVILGQGCYQSLYEMAQANCPNVFPNYDARFKYPGKIGQTKLFRELNATHPPTEIFSNIALFQRKYRNHPDQLRSRYPLVFKLDWGGEGETVYRIASAEDLQKLLTQIAEFERTGQSGFLLQEFVPCGDRTLRVVVIGRQIVSYWRIQQSRGAFHTSLSKGAVIDLKADPGLQQTGVAAVKKLCQKTGINLAGFDVIYSAEMDDPAPMLLEINYFFGRKGLGGSEAYYKLLQKEIRAWLAELN